MRRLGCAILICSLVACASARKLSRVGLREPASVRVVASISELRARVLALPNLPRTCPKDVGGFIALAGERVQFPLCPPGLAGAVQVSNSYLKLEERSTMEEIVNSQCRSLGLTEYGDSLENMVENFESTGPLSQRVRASTAPPTPEEIQALGELRQSLQQLVTYHLPLDRWVRRNGEFILPDEELAQLHRLIVEKQCNTTDQEVTEAHRTIRGLEELEKILRTGPQEEMISEFLDGMNQMIEKKLKGYFYP